MRGLFQLCIDLCLICAATAFAVLLRDDFIFEPVRWLALVPYLCATGLAAAVILPAAGTSWSIWRLISLRETLQIAFAAIVVVLAALGAAFAWNRLDGVPRALPVLQIMSIWGVLVGVRVALRLLSTRSARPHQFSEPMLTDARENVLIVGLTRASDLYLKAVQDVPNSRVRVAGILAASPRHRGREADRVPVLGTIEDLDKVLRDLEVAGVQVTRLVIGLRSSQLSPDIMQILIDAERSTSMSVVFLNELLGIEDRGSGVQNTEPCEETDDALHVARDDAERWASRPYWRVKRVIDVTVSGAFLLFSLPFLIVAGGLTYLSMGAPILFWQQRPGLGGRPFRVYKFRTMREAHDADGRRLCDGERVTRVGMFLRRSRLDELPQLYSVLVGDMSLIGPRPLLPVDQSPRHAARLMIRPGLTGWAQVMGGRIVSPDDKAALDIWYLQNASLWLDVKIVLLTIRMVLLGERVSRDAVVAAWRDLEQAHRDAGRIVDMHRAA